MTLSPLSGSAAPDKPATLRQAIREGLHKQPTAGFCPGFVQANVVILPQKQAFDFLLLCQRNPRALPLLEVYEPGAVAGPKFAPASDIRSDCPRYVLLQHGAPRETEELHDVWRDDLVTFLLGCSFTFESALLQAGVPVRHIEEGRNVPMYRTTVPLTPAGVFSGPMVVSMRPIPADLVSTAIQATARYPKVHGAPVCVGHPGTLGLEDIHKPDYGEAVEIRSNELPVFWACGVSGLSALSHAGVDFAITHAPGHMLVCDVKDVELEG